MSYVSFRYRTRMYCNAFVYLPPIFQHYLMILISVFAPLWSLGLCYFPVGNLNPTDDPQLIFQKPKPWVYRDIFGVNRGAT